jgi:hypothetical protein
VSQGQWGEVSEGAVEAPSDSAMPPPSYRIHPPCTG